MTSISLKINMTTYMHFLKPRQGDTRTPPPSRGDNGMLIPSIDPRENVSHLRREIKGIRAKMLALSQLVKIMGLGFGVVALDCSV